MSHGYEPASHAAMRLTVVTALAGAVAVRAEVVAVLSLRDHILSDGSRASRALRVRCDHYLQLQTQTHQAWAFELDAGTEPPVLIVARAQRYAALAAMWSHEGAPWPIPTWVVPDAARQQVILTAWETGWPGSTLLVATLPDIERAGVAAAMWTQQAGDTQTCVPLWENVPPQAEGGRHHAIV